MRRRTIITTAHSVKPCTDRRTDGTSDSRQHALCVGNDDRDRHAYTRPERSNARANQRSSPLVECVRGCFRIGRASRRLGFEHSGRNDAHANSHESAPLRNLYARHATARAAGRAEHFYHRLRGRRVLGARNTLGAAEFFVHAPAEQHLSGRELLSGAVRSDEPRTRLATRLRRSGCALRRLTGVHWNRRPAYIRRTSRILVRSVRDQHGRGDADTGAFRITGSGVLDFIE